MSAAALTGVALVVALAATVQLTAGFGFALAAVPLLAVVIDPHDAVVVSLGLATLTNCYQAGTGRRDTDRAVSGRMITGALAGMPIGLLVYVLTDERWLGVVIGLTVLAAVVLIARGLDLRHAGPRLDLAGGLASGVLTLSSGVNGPPLVFVLQARHFAPAEFRATITTVFAVLDVIGVAIFAITGDLDRDVLIAIAAALPGLALGAVAGIALRRHLDPERFRRLVLSLLLVAGIATVVSALAG